MTDEPKEETTHFRCPVCMALVAAGGETCRMCGASLQWPDGEAAPPTAIAQDGTEYPMVEADDDDDDDEG